MKAAASVYGNPDRYSQTWRATGNAIEGIASRRNDALLCLDELGELDGREAGQVAYMLANGQGKGRSKQDGELRERKAWRLLFLSTGELSLEDHAASAGQRTQAGMEVRTIQIPSDTGHHGAFEWLHGMEGGRTFADTLKAHCDHQHGSAFRTYAEALAGELGAHSERLRAEIKRIAAELTPQGAGNQVGRAINRFALVAAAGELATRLGVTGWPEGGGAASGAGLPQSMAGGTGPPWQQGGRCNLGADPGLYAGSPVHPLCGCERPEPPTGKCGWLQA